MGRADGRNVSTAELNERRVAAVRMRIDGATIERAAAETGLSRPTVIKAFKAYRAGGWKAVPVRGGALQTQELVTEQAHPTGRCARRARGEAAVAPAVMPELGSGSMTHLQRLEAESIHIMREVVAEAENPVMMYSIGKDSSVMLHLAMKAFYPAKPPFPLLHVDTTWKFREMYEFRDATVGAPGARA